MSRYRTQTVGEITYVLDESAETHEGGYMMTETNQGGHTEITNRWGTLRIQFPGHSDLGDAERDELRDVFLATETLLGDRLP